MNRRFVLLLLRGLGTGYTPGIPGTVGSLLALVLCVPVWSMGDHLGRPAIFLTLLSLSFGTALITWMGFKSLHKEWEEFDPSDIVLDEFAGTFLVTGLLSLTGQWQWILTGFVVFRFLDVLKPFPINWIEERNRFTGLVIDDLMAAVLAALLTGALWYGFRYPISLF